MSLPQRRTTEERLIELKGDPCVVLRDPEGLFEGEASLATGGLPHLDDYAACGLETAEALRDQFTSSFYFGCEADDRMNAWAFDRRVNPLGARLNALFGRID